MAIFNFDDLIKPVTRAEAQASLYQVYAVLGLKTSSWKSGAVVRTMAVAQATVLSALSQLQASIAKSGFLELAEGPWLAAVAHYVYGKDRFEAGFATGVLTLTNNGGGEFTEDADDLIFTNPTTKRTYRNTAPVTIPPGPGVTVLVPVRASEAGTASTSPAGSITELTTTLLQVVCTNPTDLIGRDAETDAALRTRCSESLGALSPMGPWDAYASAVRNAVRVDGSSIGITRIRPVKDGYGNVITYVATATGGVLGDADDPASDLGIANEAIQLHAAPLCVNATIVSATSVTIAIAYELWMYNTSGRNDAQVATDVRARLSAFIAAQPIAGNVIPGGDGVGRVYVDAIRSVIAGTYPGIIFHVIVSPPSVDVELGPEEVPALGTVTPTIHQIAPSDGVSA